MARTDLARQIVGLIGADVAAVTGIRNGWPTLVDVTTSTGVVPVAMHVSDVSPHARREYEWRFQNPASRAPVEEPNGAFPVLVGHRVLNGGAEILIAVDGRSRVGRQRRFSILFNARIMTEAAATGWSDYVSGTGERITALQPRLFPVFLEMLRADVVVPQNAIAAAAAASGLIDEDDQESGERARRLSSSYVRDERFSKDVRAAYENRCAMCRLALGLVVGAHIYPVQAPASPDRVWNGLALCHNHHAAFDAHNIWVNSDFQVHVSPGYLAAVEVEPYSQAFIDSTAQRLWLPAAARQRPRRGMLEARLRILRG